MHIFLSSFTIAYSKHSFKDIKIQSGLDLTCRSCFQTNRSESEEKRLCVMFVGFMESIPCVPGMVQHREAKFGGNLTKEKGSDHFEEVVKRWNTIE